MDISVKQMEVLPLVVVSCRHLLNQCYGFRPEQKFSCFGIEPCYKFLNSEIVSYQPCEVQRNSFYDGQIIGKMIPRGLILYHTCR